ncbi:MAG TPA: hypothetical protein VL172_08025, partial [Kofleriaceae bacterium]|nr:hypothetical protein [Kofleriaceae bacterium]
MSATNTTMRGERCERFIDELADVIAGDAGARGRHGDHLEECGACQDAAYEARVVAEALATAGDGFVVPEDLVERVLNGIDAERAPAPAPARS